MKAKGHGIEIFRPIVLMSEGKFGWRVGEVPNFVNENDFHSKRLGASDT